MAEPLTAALAAAAKALAESEAPKPSPEVEEFVLQITGSARQELSAWFADYIRFQRLRLQLRLFDVAQRLLKKRGREPREVKMNVLLPLLDAATLEEDDSMASRWAALLANAADPNVPEVPPSFPEVLRQLAPLDAHLLEFIAAHDVDSKHEDLNPSPVLDRRFDRYQPLELRALKEVVAPTAALQTFLVSVENLARLRLVEFVTEAREGLGRRVTSTAYGYAFVQACRST